MKIKNRTILVSVAALIAVALLTLSGSAIACTPGTQMPVSPQAPGTDIDSPVVSEWQIPYISEMTGPAAQFGLGAAWGVEQAAKDINAAGGIRGIPVKLVPYDSAYDPAKAIEAMSKAVNGGLIVIGPMADITTDAAVAVSSKAGVPIIADGSFLVKREKYAPWMVSLYPDWVAGCNIGMEEWLKLNPDFKSLVLCYIPMATSHSLMVDGLKEDCSKLGIDIIGELELQWGQIDFGPPATKGLQLNPDGYCIVSNEVESAQLIIALNKRGMTDGNRILVGGQCISSGYLEMAKGNLENTYAWNFYDMNYSGSLWKSYAEAYKASHDGGLPYSVAVNGWYEALWGVKTCFEDLKITGDPAKLSQERVKIRDWVWNCKGIPGLQGDWGWTNGEKFSPIYLFQIHNDMPQMIKQIR